MRLSGAEEKKQLDTWSQSSGAAPHYHFPSSLISRPLSLQLVLVFLPAGEILGFARHGRPLSLECLHQDECAGSVF